MEGCKEGSGEQTGNVIHSAGALFGRRRRYRTLREIEEYTDFLSAHHFHIQTIGLYCSPYRCYQVVADLGTLPVVIHETHMLESDALRLARQNAGRFVRYETPGLPNTLYYPEWGPLHDEH